ncbi:toprim domain-containing protein [Helicobacter cinaedi]|uniref:toprim domain-containing protein n=1 Tax=Helicobacter cinaedi TaxID=213 RepID=UPI000DA10DD7|nr:toprim domain-containing protein [Helicobacter cinaedi]
MESTRENTASALMSLGYKISRSWHFAIRDERTPSAFINQNGHIHDFGSDWHGDFPSFLKEFRGFHNIGDIDGKWLGQYRSNRKTHFEAYSKLLRALLPSVKSGERRREIALRYDIGYQSAGNFKGKPFPERLIMPIRDEAGRIVTLWKYNPTLAKHERLRYTRGRRRSAFNLSDLLKYREAPQEPIFIVEGEKDVLNAVAHGIRTITPGSATSLFNESQLSMLKDLRLMVVGDYDEAGKNFNAAIKKQLKAHAKVVSVLDWEKFLKSKGRANLLKKGFDLSDWLEKRN